MKYGHIYYFYLLALIPILIIGFIIVEKKRKSAMRRFAQIETISRIIKTISTRLRITKISFIILGVLFLIFALVEPKWGYHLEEVSRRGIDIVIAVDTSRSMLADDIKPDRLSASKRKIEDLLRVLKGDRIGLVAFAGSAFTYCPLTVDYGAFRLFLDDLDTSVIPLGGTDFNLAIEKCIESFDTEIKKHKTIILITDGEDHSGKAIEAAKKAEKNGIIIYTVGIGKKEGSYIKVKEKDGSETLLKDRNGQVIKSRLDEVMLNKIALETGGVYTPAYGIEWGLEKIYKDEISKIEEKEFGAERIRRYEHRFQIPLLIALILITLESFMGKRRINRRE